MYNICNRTYVRINLGISEIKELIVWKFVKVMGMYTVFSNIISCDKSINGTISIQGNLRNEVGNGQFCKNGKD